MNRNRFFPQDAMWEHADRVELEMLKLDDRWHLSYSIKGSLSPEASEDGPTEMKDEGGDLLDAEPEHLDILEFVGAIVGDLKRQAARKV